MSLMWISYIKGKTKKRHIRRRREICKYTREKTVCKNNTDLNTDIISVCLFIIIISDCDIRSKKNTIQILVNLKIINILIKQRLQMIKLVKYTGNSLINKCHI